MIDGPGGLIAYAMQFVGTPYRWGGNNPMQGGVDCSGYVCEILRFAGLIGSRQDLSAQGLFDLLSRDGTPGVFGAGVIAFYGASVTKISHVAFMTSAYQILEAGGGDSSTDTTPEAAERNAMVRGRHLRHRADLVATVRPRYAKIGVV